MPGKIGASLVAMNLVPMHTPSAPSASAAANCLPVPTPPHAKYGTRNVVLALAKSTKPPTSFVPGCPAHSNPSIDTASAPNRSAACA